MPIQKKTFFQEKYLRAFLRIIRNSGGEISDVRFTHIFGAFVVYYKLPKPESFNN